MSKLHRFDRRATQADSSVDIPNLAMMAKHLSRRLADEDLSPKEFGEIEEAMDALEARIVEHESRATSQPGTQPFSIFAG